MCSYVCWPITCYSEYWFVLEKSIFNFYHICKTILCWIVEDNGEWIIWRYKEWDEHVSRIVKNRLVNNNWCSDYLQVLTYLHIHVMCVCYRFSYSYNAPTYKFNAGSEQICRKILLGRDITYWCGSLCEGRVTV